LAASRLGSVNAASVPGPIPDPFAAARGGLVVSVQAPPGSPLRAPEHMAAMARAAAAGGARAIRAEGAADVRAIKASVGIPVIGLRKRELPDSPVYITPELRDAGELVAAGADAIAFDATRRERPGGVDVATFVERLRAEIEAPLLADVDTFEAGVAARQAGADAVATTLAGYTGEAPAAPGAGAADAALGRRAGAAGGEPDLELVRRLAAELDCPVLAEGRYSTPEHVAAAFEAGAHAVVVGTAITDPLALTRRFVASTPG
jgi:N-acylglucosamine-6-phosphate 2-epimerase